MEETEVRLVGGESTVVAVLAAIITTTSATRGDKACDITSSLKSLLNTAQGRPRPPQFMLLL